MPSPCIGREYAEWLTALVQHLVRRQDHRILESPEFDTCVVRRLSKLALDLNVIRAVVLIKVNAFRSGLLSESKDQ
jgi:hypothetical protein